jgi:RimJ/RimL family protein N-acetyltransferase
MGKLRALKLEALALAWSEQQKNPEITRLSFDERFELLIDAQWMQRENARLVRSLKEAKLRLNQACLEDIDFHARRELDRSQVMQLATCRWID